MELWHIWSNQNRNVLVNYVKWYFAEVRPSALYFLFWYFWVGKLNVSTTCALVDTQDGDLMKSKTNFELTVTEFDMFLICFNCFISPFSWSWYAKLKIIKVASETESRSALISNVLEPLLNFTGITWRNVTLSTFWFRWLKVFLMLACCCMLSWCSKVWCVLTTKVGSSFPFAYAIFYDMCLWKTIFT